MTEKNTAVSVLERMGINVKPSTTLAINGVDFTFICDQAAHDAMLNEVDDKNKITPIKDYLLTIIAPEQKADLMQIINIPNFAPVIAAKVNEVLFPKLEITVKN